MSGIKNYVLNETSILSGFLFNFYALKTLPYTLLLYGKQGTADFGDYLGIKIPYYPAVLSRRLMLSSDNVN